MFEIKLVKGASPEGGTLITAFPSIGMVGTIAGSFLADALKLERLAYVVSDSIPPAALVQDGIPTYPLRIVGHKGLAILSSEFPLPLAASGALARTMLSWASENGYELIVGLEGLMTEQPTEQPKEVRVFGVGSTDHARQLASKAGIDQFKIGMITGFSGALLSEGDLQEKDVIVLLADAIALYPDARGAAKLVESIDKLLPSVEVDLKELYEEAEKIEENVKAAVEQTKELLAARQAQAERLGKSYMYG
jgi:uncharacterized protein